ncbi:MAG: methanogenesis marker 8 protein [Methanomassiliicoccales archaeon]
MDRHVVEALGRTRVVIENGKVTEIGVPRVEYCPLFNKYRGIEKITPEIVQKNIAFRIKDFGMCTPRRELRMRDFLTFGISELMAMAVSKGFLDCAVVVCDGAGTAVVTDPELIQGIGGRVSGITETTPYMEVVDCIGRERVLDPETGRIDQFEGTGLAIRLGFKMIGVTLVASREAKRIRKRFGDHVVLFAVHTSGVSKKETEGLLEECDVVTACASKWIRELAPEKSLLQAGKKIPVFAMTELGKKIVGGRLKETGASKSNDSADVPRPLI